jgi:hypothetical protein
MPSKVKKTAYGKVRTAALEELGRSFDTKQLMNAVDQLDRLRELVTAPGFRDDLLRLHGMAHTIINGAAIAAPPGGEAVWELAGSLSMELEEIVEDLTETVDLLNRLADLAPDDDEN